MVGACQERIIVYDQLVEGARWLGNYLWIIIYIRNLNMTLKGCLYIKKSGLIAFLGENSLSCRINQ
jgi:hypothetical protein